MKASYNQHLRSSIGNSVLHHAAPPLFLCDENLYVCLKSIGAEKAVKQPITGANFDAYMDDSLKKRILEMNSGWLRGTVYLNSVEMDVIVYCGEVGGEKYYAILSEEGRIFRSYADMTDRMNKSINVLIDRMGRIIDELLHSQTSDTAKLNKNCVRMIRLKQFIYIALNDTVSMSKYRSGNDGGIAVDLLLGCICDICNDNLPAYGYRIELDGDKADLCYCECSTRSLITFICTLLFNVITISESGLVRISCVKRLSSKIMEIRFTTESKLSEAVADGELLELADVLMRDNSYPFVLDLIASSEIAKILKWNTHFSNMDGQFSLGIELPVNVTGIPVFKLRANSAESDYVRQLVGEFLDDISHPD